MLLDYAQRYAKAGLSVFPVSGKRPNARLLPRIKNAEGKETPSWSPFQLRIPNDHEIKSFFSARDTTGMAVACGPVSNAGHKNGGLYIIDVDRVDWVNPFLDRCGKATKNAVIQRTGRGGIQVAMVCRGSEELRNQKIAMYANPEYTEGANIPRHLCGIESRGFGGYACIAPSIHPNGNRYEVLEGNFENMGFTDESDVLTILEAAQSFSEVTATEIRTGKSGERKQHRLNIPRLIMDTFMGEFGTIDRYLVRHGYTMVGRNRMLRPGGVRGNNMPGVLISDDGDAAYFWSSNDPLNQYLNSSGQPFHDIVGACVGLEYNGDFYNFLEEEGARFGIEYYRPQPEDDITLERHTPDTTNPVVYGADTKLPVVFLVGDTEAAKHLANQGVAAVVTSPAMAMDTVLTAIQPWSQRYVMMERSGFSDALTEGVWGKWIDSQGLNVTTLGGAELFHLVNTAQDVQWHLDATALRKRWVWSDYTMF